MTEYDKLNRPKPSPSGAIAPGDGTAATVLPTRVLIAEDESLVASALSASVRSLGCRVVGPVADGQAALLLAEKEPPDFALLDIRMPGLDGLSAAQMLWDRFNVPSAIVSAYSDPAYVARAQQTGVFGFLIKPVQTDMLRVGLSIAWSKALESGALSQRVQQLDTLLKNRRTIERAKWRLVSSRGLTEPDAHLFLQTEARNQRRKLVDVARALVGDEPADAAPESV